MSERLFVGVDLGGTNIKAGLLDGQGGVRIKISIATEGEGGPDHVIGRIGQAIKEVIEKGGVARPGIGGVGIGAPGSMNAREGIIILPPNLPGWYNVPLRDRVRELSGLPTLLENDANAAAVGEFWAGAGKGTSDVVIFTLGTGVGGGVISEGRIIRGYFDNAGELGHMIVQPNGRKCGCGQVGCLESYSSAAATAKLVSEALEAGGKASLRQRLDAGEPIESVHVEQAAKAGDALAERIWDEACFYLALACVNMQHFCNPQRVVLSGGMIGAGDFLLDRVRKHLDQQTWKAAEDKPEVVLATLGNDAGFIGAAGSAWRAWQDGKLD